MSDHAPHKTVRLALEFTACFGLRNTWAAASTNKIISNARALAVERAPNSAAATKFLLSGAPEWCIYSWGRSNNFTLYQKVQGTDTMSFYCEHFELVRINIELLVTFNVRVEILKIALFFWTIKEVLMKQLSGLLSVLFKMKLPAAIWNATIRCR